MASCMASAIVHLQKQFMPGCIAAQSRDAQVEGSCRLRPRRPSGARSRPGPAAPIVHDQRRRSKFVRFSSSAQIRRPELICESSVSIGTLGLRDSRAERLRLRRAASAFERSTRGQIGQTSLAPCRSCPIPTSDAGYSRSQVQHGGCYAILRRL